MNRQVSNARDLTGKVALVTGAGRRLGAEIARALRRSGASLALHHHGSGEGAQALARELSGDGARCVTFGADLSSASEAESLVDRVLAEFGRLDVLILSAAIFERTPFGQVDAATWDRTMAINVRAPALIAQRASAALRDSGGTIVLLTCTSATAPYRNYLPYVVSKGAAKQLMKTLALELAPEVRVNAVAPGTVLPPPSMSPEECNVLAERTLVGHLGTADDVVDAVLYLVGANFVTGVEILVDGGVTLSGRPSGEGS